jgi:D-serine deaminase-like pyridoxal phosphate-dependent protein
MEVSMKLDTAIRAGLQAAQTRAFGGLQEFGGFVSHSPKETQEFRLGFHAAALSQSDGADVSRLQETWTQLSLGYVIGF